MGMSNVPGDDSHTGVEYSIQPGRGRVEMGSQISIARGSVAHITTWKATMLPQANQAAFGHLWMANRFPDGPCVWRCCPDPPEQRPSPDVQQPVHLIPLFQQLHRPGWEVKAML